MRQAEVASNVEVAERFHLIELRGPGLRNAGWAPGHKMQLSLGARGTRTFTPIDWDRSHGRTQLLPTSPRRWPG
jgi:NAD(P)H-flavin reductase